ARLGSRASLSDGEAPPVRKDHGAARTENGSPHRAGCDTRRSEILGHFRTRRAQRTKRRPSAIAAATSFPAGPNLALCRGMFRGLCRSLMVPVVTALLAGNINGAAASGSTKPSVSSPGGIPILQRFLTISDPDPTDFRVLRRVDAHSERFAQSAWRDVWTEADRHGLRYRIVAEGG